MHLPDSIIRFLEYGRRHGFDGTSRRIRLAFKHMLRGNRQVLFYCDLASFTTPDVERLGDAKVERKSAEEELDAKELLMIVNAWNPEITRRHISKRFGQGASLWLLKLEDKLAGYGWTTTGRTMEPHFLPLGSNDVHLFDFFVFPEYRGQRLNPSFVSHILRRLASDRRSRAYIEAAEWNTAQLHSLSRTPFQNFGRAWKCCIFGKTIVLWTRSHLKEA
jgi:GNAT superfamily N-acetyltransferase